MQAGGVRMGKAEGQFENDHNVFKSLGEWELKKKEIMKGEFVS
jgi:hypothetical protein